MMETVSPKEPIFQKPQCYIQHLFYHSMYTKVADIIHDETGILFTNDHLFRLENVWHVGRTIHQNVERYKFTILIDHLKNNTLEWDDSYLLLDKKQILKLGHTSINCQNYTFMEKLANVLKPTHRHMITAIRRVDIKLIRFLSKYLNPIDYLDEIVKHIPVMKLFSRLNVSTNHILYLILQKKYTNITYIYTHNHYTNISLLTNISTVYHNAKWYRVHDYLEGARMIRSIYLHFNLDLKPIIEKFGESYGWRRLKLEDDAKTKHTIQINDS